MRVRSSRLSAWLAAAVVASCTSAAHADPPAEGGARVEPSGPPAAASPAAPPGYPAYGPYAPYGAPPYYGGGYPPGPPPGGWQAAPALPPPRTPAPGRHLHEGFFLRMGLGVGHSSYTLRAPNARYGDVTARGGGVATELSVGGTPLRGLVVAGTLLGQSGENATTATADGGITLADTTLRLSAVGVLVEGYPDPAGGFFAGGSLAYASSSVRSPASSTSGYSASQTETGTGFAVAPHAGYGFWVGDDWSLGGLVRLTWARTSQDHGSNGGEIRQTSFSPSVLFVATFH